MLKFQLYFLLLFTTLCCGVAAQDIHWSQFNNNQIFQNPGNAGNFKGDYRFITNYRDQWRSVTTPFSTFSFSADSRLVKHNKIGIGGLFFNDVAGDGKFRTIEFQTNFAYLIKLSTDSTHTIRPGINIGINHRQVNWDQFSFDNQYNGIAYNAALPTFENYQNQKNTNLSLGVGAVYEYFSNDHKKLTGGVGFYNLNRPNQSFYGEKVKRDMRTSLFVKGTYPMNKDWDLIPSISLQFQGKYREFIMGSSLKHTLIDQLGEYRAVYVGAWFRSKDAGYFTVGLDYQSWFLGLSYDINISKLVPASNLRGGIEFAARYIINRFKPKKILHRACPEYI